MRMLPSDISIDVSRVVKLPCLSSCSGITKKLSLAWIELGGALHSVISLMHATIGDRIGIA